MQSLWYAERDIDQELWYHSACGRPRMGAIRHCLGTTWNEQAHVQEDGRTIPMGSSLLTSALGATNFSGERWRGPGRVAPENSAPIISWVTSVTD